MRRLSLLVTCVLMCLLITPIFATDDMLQVQKDGTGNITISVPNSEFDPGTDNPYEHAMSEYKKIAQGITGVCTITALICFLYQITRLGAAGDNQRNRQEAIRGILFSGIVLTVFGSLTLIVSFFWNVLK